MTIDLIRPDWPSPPGVCALATTRQGGVSEGTYSSFNLADHVGDTIPHVLENRDRLHNQLRLPTEPVWLEQVHGTTLVPAGPGQIGARADGSYTSKPGVVCAVMTADCLPVLFCDRDATRVAAVHAGWRGLAAGILEQAVTELDVTADQLLVWLGSAIGPQAFEVGDEVKAAFVASQTEAELAFVAHGGGHWLADLYQLARLRLQALGVTQIYGGNRCTYSEPEHFFSYRRDGQTGRMATLIWLDNSQ